MMAEAEELAAEFSLPIIVGDGSRLDWGKMDKGKASVVLVPDSHYVVLPDEHVEAGIAWPITYHNDFDDISSGCSVMVTDPAGAEHEAQVGVSEKHYARFFYRPLTTGRFSVTVLLNGVIKAEGGFNVY